MLACKRPSGWRRRRDCLRQTFGAESRAAATLIGRSVTRLSRINPLIEAKPCPVHAGSFWTRAGRMARFVMVPAMASTGAPNNEPTYNALPPDGCAAGRSPAARQHRECR